MRIVGGKYRGKTIRVPSHRGTRPTADRTRETIFNILLHNPVLGLETLIDKTVLDVFAGTGALGLEAFSRGAKSVTFIENEREIVPLLKSNIKAFNLPESSVLADDACHLHTRPLVPFDLIFLDPPYHQGFLLPSLEKLFMYGWLANEAVVIIEMEKNESLSLPPFLSLLIERISGAAKILFCRAA
ncbi:MAG: 16S rRNA (guanine(966)-N(2))-methyltransferase RsmD [Alphaproteobacteria bacterium]|nr:16S rRNA (guanine(966)-N(2))-methyltransferase RsmD [Alphaproteobacteria bacterium]